MVQWPGWSILTEALYTRSQNAESWEETPLTEEDIQHVEHEGFDDSPFDPLGLRRSMITRARQCNGGVEIRCRSCKYAKVIVLFELKEGDPTPWELWGRIFAAMGPPLPNQGDRWRVVWFANPSLREFAPIGFPVGPAHVNGGYAYPCKPDTIVIYRREEGTRVLLHELLHAGCTDDHRNSTEQKEAETETWAELFLIGILAAGSATKAARLWNKQAAWIAHQNARLRVQHGVREPRDYAWRYTIARESVLQRLGLSLPKGDARRAPNSLRFTSPALIQN